MTIEQATERCKEIIPVFREAWNRAWQDIKGYLNNPDWDERCRSTVLQMQAVIHAKHATFGIPDIKYFSFEKRHLFEVVGSCLIQLKQLDSRLRSKNYQTTMATEFLAQKELSGIESVPRLTVGLVPDSDWIDIAGIYLTYPKSNLENNWALDITGEPIDVNSNQKTFDEPTFKENRRWRPKRDQNAAVSEHQIG